MKKVTITDVAQQAGVSVAAVSRYINNSGSLSKEKRILIKKTIDEMGYSFVKESKQESNLIGAFAFSGQYNVFHQKLMNALAYAAAREGKSLLLIHGKTKISNRSLPELIQKAMKYPLDGLLITGFVDKKMTDESIRLLSNLPMPVVLLERTGGCHNISSVTFDNKSSIQEAVKYLFDMGHREIAYIGCSIRVEIEIQRNEGFWEALRQYNIPADKRRIILQENYSVEHGRAAMKKILKSGCPFTAVLAASDELAIGAMQIIQEAGLQIPEEISVMGFGDSYSDVSFPPLTNMAFPMEEAAAAAISIVMEKRKTKGRDTAKHISFEMNLMSRETVQLK